MAPPSPPKPAGADVEHFRSIPWCARHIEAPGIVAYQAPCKSAKPAGGPTALEDALFSRTLNSDDTIAAFAIFHARPDGDSSVIRELKSFLTLGDMVDGHPGVCHGGIVMTIMDEVIGSLPFINMRRGALKDDAHLTAYLNTTMLRPVRTPGTIMSGAKFTRIEGRKYFLEGWIEDENGVLLAKADALFVAVRGKI